MAIKTVIQTVQFDAELDGPPIDMAWLGHRRLTVVNEFAHEVTVILMPTNYDQDFNMDNVKIAAACRRAFLGKNLLEKTVCLKYFLSHLASLIQLQKVNEASEERSLLASPFMKSLVSLCEVFHLDQVFKTSEILSVDIGIEKMVDIPAPNEIWQWMTQAIQAIRALNNLDRSQVKQNSQLIQWVGEKPLDWQLGGPCKAFMFGRNKEGQLADATDDSNDPEGQLPTQGTIFLSITIQSKCSQKAVKLKPKYS